MVAVAVDDPDRHVRIPDALAKFTVGLSLAQDLQAIVGGYFEVFYDRDAQAHVYVNEEGRMRQLPANRRFGGHDVVGTALFSTVDEEGELAGLSDEDVERIQRLYG